ncbi:tRNA glutamyl-Q(34) synthetase GluQRS [Sphingomonas sp. Y38-1Y]|uniref:tRNA glutamyl-Q(34) synthetase GluQRS n=1 Tax=Sphingomonas sp. Y38-1Y TaxID=3078265 RepID=UPI0028E7D035|nr:tRNA glutamyl-Q(34) synthetase GluQRS [Sphingomonas sp. Y38-1Y]
MSVTTRFAPSPTGALHLGHAWSAVQAHVRARDVGGRFLLRIEDIDGTRSRPEHVAGILADLDWLGLDWDGDVVFQSARLDRYTAALDRLRVMGLVYPCTCTRADIAAAASAPHGPAGVVYPGTCRERAADLSQPHCWRLDMAAAIAAAGPLVWTDEIAGTIAADPASHGDVVLARKDAPSSYHLSVTVDDAAQGITHIVRGRDLFEATHVHRLLQALLGLPTPIYRHHPLLAGADGTRLAKRHGAPSLANLRAAGMDGRALAMDLKRGRLPLGFGVLDD